MTSVDGIFLYFGFCLSFNIFENYCRQLVFFNLMPPSLIVLLCNSSLTKMNAIVQLESLQMWFRIILAKGPLFVQNVYFLVYITVRFAWLSGFLLFCTKGMAYQTKRTTWLSIISCPYFCLHIEFKQVYFSESFLNCVFLICNKSFRFIKFYV